jgi:hypothetical protein
MVLGGYSTKLDRLDGLSYFCYLVVMYRCCHFEWHTVSEYDITVFNQLKRCLPNLSGPPHQPVETGLCAVLNYDVKIKDRDRGSTNMAATGTGGPVLVRSGPVWSWFFSGP